MHLSSAALAAVQARGYWKCVGCVGSICCGCVFEKRGSWRPHYGRVSAILWSSHPCYWAVATAWALCGLNNVQRATWRNWLDVVEEWNEYWGWAVVCTSVCGDIPHMVCTGCVHSAGCGECGSCWHGRVEKAMSCCGLMAWALSVTKWCQAQWWALWWVDWFKYVHMPQVDLVILLVASVGTCTQEVKRDETMACRCVCGALLQDEAGRGLGACAV